MTEACAPAVSVIVPLYNKRATVSRTLESIFAQTFADFEVIVVDDGSGDYGYDFIHANYGHEPRMTLVRQENAGPGAARNRGAGMARGRYVTFLDADDEWLPGFLERAVSTLDAHGAPALYSANFYVQPQGATRWDDLQRKGLPSGQWWLKPGSTPDEIRYFWRAIHSCATVYRRREFLEAGGFYEDRCTFGEDVWLWMRLLLRYSVHLDPEPLAHYHTEASSLGIGARSGELPIEPILQKPAGVRAVCPQGKRIVFDRWLAQHAAVAAFMQLGRGNRENARWLLARHPRIREWPGDYWKLRIRCAIPEFRKIAFRGARAVWRATA